MTSALYRPGDDGYRLPQRGQHYYQDPTDHGARSRKLSDRKTNDELGYYGRDPHKKGPIIAPVMIPPPGGKGDHERRDTDSLAESSEYDPEEDLKKSKKKYWICIIIMVIFICICVILAVIIIWWFFSATEDPGTQHKVAFNVVFELDQIYESDYGLDGSTKKTELSTQFCSAMAVTLAPAFVECEIFALGRGNGTVEVESGIYFDLEQLETMALLAGKSADHMTIRIMLYSMMTSAIKKAQPPLLGGGEVKEIDRYVQYEIFAHLQEEYQYDFGDKQSDLYQSYAKKYCTGVENTFLRAAVQCGVAGILPDFEDETDDAPVLHTMIKSVVKFDLQPLFDKIKARGHHPTMDVFLTFIRVFLSEEIEQGNIDVLANGDIQTISKFVTTKSIPFEMAIAFNTDWRTEYTDMSSNWSMALAVGICSNFTHSFKEWTEIYDAYNGCSVLKFYEMQGVTLGKCRLNFKRSDLETYDKDRVVFGRANETIFQSLTNISTNEEHEAILLGMHVKDDFIIQLPDEDWNLPSTQYVSYGNLVNTNPENPAVQNPTTVAAAVGTTA